MSPEEQIAYKARESRIRQQLARDGYRLVAHSIRDPRRRSRAGYWVVAVYSNTVVLGRRGQEVSLDTVEQWLG